jgi:hypothetical protein
MTLSFPQLPVVGGLRVLWIDDLVGLLVTMGIAFLLFWGQTFRGPREGLGDLRLAVRRRRG